MELPELEQLTAVFQQSFALNFLLAALLFGFILSFAVGANDSANSWGTPVSSSISESLMSLCGAGWCRDGQYGGRFFLGICDGDPGSW